MVFIPNARFVRLTDRNDEYKLKNNDRAEDSKGPLESDRPERSVLQCRGRRHNHLETCREAMNLGRVHHDSRDTLIRSITVTYKKGLEF